MNTRTTISLAEALTELDRIRKDLTNAQAKLTDVKNAIAAHPDSEGDPRPRCPHCNVQLRGQLALAEHVHTSHDGPIPDHWIAAERAAGLDEHAPTPESEFGL